MQEKQERIINTNEIPLPHEWEPTEDQIYFATKEEGKYVVGLFGRIDPRLGEDETLSTFLIKRTHFAKRMDSLIVHHLNYFITYFDPEKELFLALASMKYMITIKPDMPKSVFRKLLMERVFTDSFMARLDTLSKMVYDIDVETDKEDKYKNAPKITNEQARMIVACSFCIRFIMPLCIHYISHKKEYKRTFMYIYIELFRRLEAYFGINMYFSIYSFVDNKLQNGFAKDSKIWSMKKQDSGITYETEFQNMVNEKIIVKSLYKYDYRHSPVSYLDSIVYNSYKNFLKEKFANTPSEISAEDAADEDEYMSRAEALEMAAYRIDESNMVYSEVNNEWTMKCIKERINIDISNDELTFYQDNFKANSINQFLLNCFYSKYFNSGDAIDTLNREDIIFLVVLLKKFLEAKGMIILPQILTASVKNKLKESVIKNNKFIEKFTSSSMYKNVIESKFKYISEIKNNQNFIIKRVSTIINSVFTIVDYNPQLNGVECNEMPDRIIDEFETFLSIM